MKNLEKTDPKVLRKFWTGVRKDYATGVLNHLRELRAHVTNTSKTTWFLQLEWKKIKEKELIALFSALECLQVVYPEALEDKEFNWLFQDLGDQLVRTRKRMLGAKHLNFGFPPDLLETLSDEEIVEYLNSVREYRGNFLVDISVLLKRVFRVRFHRPPKLKRTGRIRGYRDKGSESTPSERARRNANTSTWNQYLQEALEYCQLTGCSPRQALRVLNMVPEGE